MTRWSRFLGIEVASQAAGLEYFAQHSKLAPHDQMRIQQDCLSLQQRLHYYQEADLRNTLELLLSYYIHTSDISYVSGMHEVLAPFFLIGFRSFKSVYACFTAFITKMMPGVFQKQSSVPTSCRLLHKLLLYHDPALCTLLDAKMIAPVQYADRWFLTLFACCIDVPLLLLFWELCLKENDPLLPLFFALVLVRKFKDQLLTKRTNKDQIQVAIKDFEELDSLCQEASTLQHETPKSFLRMAEALTTCKERAEVLDEGLAMKVTPQDVQVARVGNFIIDLRTNAEYVRGHYPNSYNLTKDLHMSTEELWNVLTGFSTYFANTTSRLCHFAVCSDDSQSATTTCQDLVRRGVERVSVISGGFVAYGEEHDSERCARCELNRDLIISADHPGSMPRYKKLLITMWYTFLHEEHSSVLSTPVSSTASSPRGMNPGHHFQPSQQLDAISSGDSTGRVTNTARSTEYDTSHMSISDCVKLMWTEGLREAESFFDEKRAQDSRCGLHYTEAAFLRALLIGDKASRTVALERLTQAEEAAEAQYRRVESFGDRILNIRTGSISKDEALNLIRNAQQARLAIAVYAETQLCRSGCHILHEAYIKGSLAFRTAWKQYQRCQRITDAQRSLESAYFSTEEMKTAVSQQIEDDIKNLVKFGLGVMSLSLSMAPQKVVRLAKLAAGMEADQTQGLKLLYECINMPGGVRVPLALMFVLFWLLIYIPDFIPGKEDRHREAAELMNLGRSLFRKSPFFYWLESFLREKEGQLGPALVLLERASRVSKRIGFDETPPRLAFEKGWIYFLCQDWPMSERHLEQSLQTGDPTPFTLLLLGISCLMQGNGQTAFQWFQKLQAPEMERNATERWISTRAKRFLTRKYFSLFSLEVVYLTDYIPCMTSDWHQSALRYLESLDIDVPKLPQSRSFFSLSRQSDDESDEFVIYLLLKGAVFRHLGRLRDAVTVLELAVKYHDSVMQETFAIPHAYYELGMVFVRGRDWQAAGQYLMKAKSFKRFEFRKSLAFKLESALEFVAKEEKKESKR